MSPPVPDDGASCEGARRIRLRPVDAKNWRDVVGLEVTAAQREFVANPAYYLALCTYEELWQPLAIYASNEAVGFMMWAIDVADGNCWLGGFLVDQRYQGQGYGRATLSEVISLLSEQHGFRRFALSYNPSNSVARELYRSLGFMETGEREGDEIVARLSLDP